MPYRPLRDTPLHLMAQARHITANSPLPGLSPRSPFRSEGWHPFQGVMSCIGPYIAWESTYMGIGWLHESFACTQAMHAVVRLYVACNGLLSPAPVPSRLPVQ